MEGEMLKAYIASPMFTEKQNAHITEIEDICRRNQIAFYSPRFGEASKHYAVLKSNQSLELILTKNLIFTENIKNLKESDLVFLNPEGFDSGTFFELGFALSKHKHIVCTVPEMELELREVIDRFIKQITVLDPTTLYGVTLHCEGIAIWCEDKYDGGTLITAESGTEYVAMSKILLGYLYGLNIPALSYVDVPRKTNLMLSCSADVYELTDNTKKPKDIQTISGSLKVLRHITGAEKDE